MLGDGERSLAAAVETRVVLTEEGIATSAILVLFRVSIHLHLQAASEDVVDGRVRSGGDENLDFWILAEESVDGASEEFCLARSWRTVDDQLVAILKRMQDETNSRELIRRERTAIVQTQSSFDDFRRNAFVSVVDERGLVEFLSVIWQASALNRVVCNTEKVVVPTLSAVAGGRERRAAESKRKRIEGDIDFCASERDAEKDLVRLFVVGGALDWRIGVEAALLLSSHDTEFAREDTINGNFEHDVFARNEDDDSITNTDGRATLREGREADLTLEHLALFIVRRKFDCDGAADRCVLMQGDSFHLPLSETMTAVSRLAIVQEGEPVERMTCRNTALNQTFNQLGDAFDGVVRSEIVDAFKFSKRNKSIFEVRIGSIGTNIRIS